MNSTVITAIIGAIAAIIVAVIGAWAVRRKDQATKEKESLEKPNYQDISDAYRLGIGISGLVFASAANSQAFKTAVSTGHQTIMTLTARLIPQERFPCVHSLMQQVFATGEFQTANALHEEITNAIFDSRPPAVQIGYVFGAYIPVLTGLDPNLKQMELPLSIALGALTPLRGTVYKAKDVFPKHFIVWYEDILAKRNVASAASKIIDWFNSLK